MATPATTATLNAAIAAAASYLEDARGPDLLWRDFDTLAGESADWVSGFVAYCAGSSGVLRGACAETLSALLRRQRPSGGWAYNEQVPPDCDSTAWVLLAMSTATIVKPSMVLRALSYVQRHAQGPGYATYAVEDGMERYVEAAPEQTAGWRAMHTRVSAVAVQALMLHGLVGHAHVRQVLAELVRAQDPEGLWSSYWWQGNAYATAQALRALAAGRRLTPSIWRAAAAGLLARQQAGGGFGDAGAPPHAFSTAMALSALLAWPDRRCDDAAHAAARWLLDAQRGGHWGGAPILRIPTPGSTSPDLGQYQVGRPGTGSLVRDQHGVFSTAAAMAALALYRDCLRRYG
ncbi:prenyltransferase/squalene oxidase repeat-containing protein [Pseudoduganella namucuonensis]|uniref:Squalene-hopene cyclase C-terminal domain-containing protein n=1 Tax=Pseudoduganella namucuonensis TaxID=1035707 RepID=A0A1I7M285_9BURK|nr:prenyltransferase/squalene oxidase repeat-containing protein [Pseudoduganella namucuonensis]SFV16015.1 Squalene-hopene cyclase C-terminal domain-containing protein [Pseudoduganella namucuonensis]